jgi:hypothetical protein
MMLYEHNGGVLPYAQFTDRWFIEPDLEHGGHEHGRVARGQA